MGSLQDFIVVPSHLLVYCGFRGLETFGFWVYWDWRLGLDNLALPGGMMGMVGVVGVLRRNADYSSDYAFDFSEDNGGGHPDISDYTADYADYSHHGEAGERVQGVVHHDYSDYNEREAHHGTLPIMKILETMDFSMMLEDLTIIKRNCRHFFCSIVYFPN